MRRVKDKKILIVGASGDLGFSLLDMLLPHNVLVGMHCHHNKGRLSKLQKNGLNEKTRIFSGDISSQATSRNLIKSFVKWAGGIDYLVQLSGAVRRPQNWESIKQKNWDRDIAVNLTGPYFLAQQAMQYMKKKGGKIILTSTASAGHGGGRTSMAYGAAKAAIESVTKGLAREGARYNILVNTIAPGFIKTKFHTQQMKRTPKQLRQRAGLVPLKRAGEPKDIAGMIMHLLSPYGDYITGEIIAISGGDWL